MFTASRTTKSMPCLRQARTIWWTSKLRLEAIRQVRPTENFEPLAASFKRIQNILRQAEFTLNGATIDRSLLEPGPEADLATAMQQTNSAYPEKAIPKRSRILRHYARVVDKFFDKVLVNAPDERVRRNRLTLLSSLLSEFSTIADFSEIVVTTQQ